MDICELSAVQLAGALRRRELSAVDALEAVLDRARSITATVNPFTSIVEEHARAGAEAADLALARREGGPLCGVPVSTKDSHWMAGVESTSGSRSRLGHVPTRTMGGIARLEAAGAVNFARTTVPELCYFGITRSGLFGRTANPWNLHRTAGGSSGGAAAAVAAGCGPLSLGGDGGGSIRIPAAFCGVVGFKPTHGALSHEPSGPEWKSLVSVGPLARTVADARLLFEAVAAADPADRSAVTVHPLGAPATDGLRMAVSADLGFAPLDDDVRRAFDTTIAALAAAGVDLVEASPGLGSSIEPWSTIALAEAFVAEGAALAARPADYGEAAAGFIAAGEAVSMPAYVRAQFARERIHAAYAELFARTGARVLVTPALGCEAFEDGPGHPLTIGGVPIGYPDLDWAPFLYDANLAGLPACVVPVGLGDDGLPVAVQVLGRRLDDRGVLAAAEVVEQVVAPVGAPPRKGFEESSGVRASR